MICYESVVKNVVDVTLFFHNTFIFSCSRFWYDILFYFILVYKKLTSQKL